MVAVQVADLPPADPERELAAATGASLHTWPGKDLFCDLLTRRLCLGHGLLLEIGFTHAWCTSERPASSGNWS
jgi:hypothetical protein